MENKIFEVMEKGSKFVDLAHEVDSRSLNEAKTEPPTIGS